jgi:hypothetical protein
MYFTEYFFDVPLIEDISIEFICVMFEVFKEIKVWTAVSLIMTLYFGGGYA